MSRTSAAVSVPIIGHARSANRLQDQLVHRSAYPAPSMNLVRGQIPIQSGIHHDDGDQSIQAGIGGARLEQFHVWG